MGAREEGTSLKICSSTSSSASQGGNHEHANYPRKSQNATIKNLADMPRAMK
jgi:hypothetical protein